MQLVQIKKCGAFAALLVCIVVSATALGMQDRYDTGGFYRFVQHNPSEVSVGVQIIAQLLAFCQLFATVTAIDLSARRFILHRALPLPVLQLLGNICSGSLDFSLSKRHMLIAALFHAFWFIPAAGWAGAITPTIIQTTQAGAFPVPKYTLDPQNQSWNISTALDQRNGVYSFQAGLQDGGKSTPDGHFSYTPAYSLGSVILQSASIASEGGQPPPTYPKPDWTQFAYKTRSYGIGAAIGISGSVPGFNANDTNLNVNRTGFAYEETGYYSTVNCFVNTSSDWRVQFQAKSIGDGFPATFLANGTLSNSIRKGGGDLVPNSFAAFGFVTGGRIVAMASLGQFGRNVLAFAVGGDPSQSDYAVLNNTQCDVTFAPSRFAVHVDLLSRTIEVQPIPGSVNNTNDIDPSSPKDSPGTGLLAAQVMQQLGQISLINTSLYTSTVGDALRRNIQTVQQKIRVQARSARSLMMRDPARRGNQNGNNGNGNGSDDDNTDSDNDNNDGSTSNSNPKAGKSRGGEDPDPDPDAPANAAAMSALSDSVAAMLDDLLVAYAGAQIVVATSSSGAAMELDVLAARVGSPPFQIAMLTFSTVLFLMLAVEGLRTRAWRDLSALDFRDLVAAVVAASRGGKALADRADRSASSGSNGRKNTKKNNNDDRASDEPMGWGREFKVRTREDAAAGRPDPDVALVPANEGHDDDGDDYGDEEIGYGGSRERRASSSSSSSSSSPAGTVWRAKNGGNRRNGGGWGRWWGWGKKHRRDARGTQYRAKNVGPDEEDARSDGAMNGETPSSLELMHASRRSDLRPVGPDAAFQPPEVSPMSSIYEARGGGGGG